MATDWNNLRPWNGSREKGFEELCCQLAAGESYPAGSRFVRKGAPDAGVECFWTLPAGDEHGWQAKFFTSPPTAGQWAQINESVETALATHPRLTKYTVCLPLDRPDARLKRQKSFLDKWNDHVAVWKKRAAKRRMIVEFEFWGDHELTSRLNREENRGRHWFWFRHEQFTLEWFQKKLRAAIENAGERYTPVLHVDLPIAKYFSALGRTEPFHNAVNELYQKEREAATRFDPARLPPDLKDVAASAQAAVAKVSQLFDAVLLPIHNSGVVGSLDPIPWDELQRAAEPTSKQLNQMWSSLWEQLTQKEKQAQESAPDTSAALPGLKETLHYCREFGDSLSELVAFCGSVEAAVANRPALLMVGEAGQGKTHLLCDIADKDLKDGKPRILLHGAHFKDGEPWSQIVQLLGLNCSNEEFLGALEAAGRAYGCRVLILIDALNEGPGRGLWKKFLPGMLGDLAGNPWVGVAVSVRSSYEELVIPSALVPTRLSRVIHRGFEEHEYEAVNRFFVHFGIQPTIPLLVPEFTNPLFLKLFCQAMKEKGWKQMPLGLRGITAILETFLDGVNEKLSKPERMDYDRLSNPVKKATDALVRLMAEQGTYLLPRDLAVAAVNNVHKVDGYDRSLFRNLVVEGVLAENRWMGESGETEIVSFAYERFGDHLLAKHLLETALDRKNPKKSFGARRRLGKLLGTPWESYRYAGVIEALSVQLPETIGKELFELVPHATKFQTVQEGFLKSLVWRTSAAFSRATFRFINDLARYKGPWEEILNALLTVAPVPDHPLNADKLHEILSRPTMAERDAWWSTFLHGEWSAMRALNRIIDWTWGESDKSAMPASVVLLTGTALAWFLTSSNRFLRDRATKALVKLFENRLVTFKELLERFWTVNDPYVLERLLAAGYGCAMRSQDPTGMAELAENVSKNVFRKRTLLPQLLTRDYARGIVERTRHLSVVASDAFPESRPPYKSRWPSIKIPTARSIEEWGKWWEGMPAEEWSRHEIYASVMGSGLSDFSRYVIGDLDQWTSVRRGTTPPKTAKDRFDEFVDGLRPAQKKALARFQTAFRNLSLYRGVSAELRQEFFKCTLTDEELDGILAVEESRLANALKTPAIKRLFKTVARPYITEPNKHNRPYAFDGKRARRWMMQRIIDYGWTGERFGEFDRTVNYRSAGRESHKPERIGKKYQWIALHELLARLSDNFHMRRERYGDEGFREYSGPWDIGYGSARDIDPSVTIRRMPKDDKMAGRAWWSSVGYSRWRTDGADIDWIRAAGDLPKVEELFQVRSPHDGRTWLVLDTHVEWRQPAKPGRKDFDDPRRYLWYIIRSYLVRRADAATFFRWAKRQDFMGRWMPEPHDAYHIFHGEYFWAPAYRESIGDYQPNPWTRGDGDRVPTDLCVTCLEFAHESSGYDCSVDDSLRIKLMSEPLITGMRLRWGGTEGRYVDANGALTAFDPSVHEPGPGALLVRQDALKEYLAENDLELFWTVLGEKQLIGGWSRNEEGWLQVRGAYRLTDGGIVGTATPTFRQSGERRARPRRRK